MDVKDKPCLKEFFEEMAENHQGDVDDLVYIAF